MKFQLNHTKPSQECLVVGVFEQHKLSSAAEKLDKNSRRFLSTLLKHSEMAGKPGQVLLLHHVPHVTAKRVLLAGCGKHNKPLTTGDFRKIVMSCAKALNTAKVSRAQLLLTELEVEKRSLPWKIKQIVEVCSDAVYQFNQYKSDPNNNVVLQEIDLAVEKNQLGACTEALKQGMAIASAVATVKDLANQPGNVCTPAYLAQQAKALTKQYKTLNVKVVEEATMKKLGMNALLTVAKGSIHAPKLICFEYHGGKKKSAPIALVGKGITFDTGGISLKPADSMIGMKYDMCGSATVFGVMKAAAELKLPLNLVGLMVCAENMPDGNAAKPEDIVKTMSGQTVEILNTDAEGRLVLSDALTYCERFYKPETVIDIATLTGAVVIALGFHASGLLSNHQPLADELLAAGIESHDRGWQMPLWEEYQEQLRSPFADMSNVGGRSAGTITAACFLSRFTKKFHWAHLDVAGTAAMMMGTDRYATGRPVPMLVQFLLNRC